MIKAGSGTARGMSPQARYDIDRAVPLTRWLGKAALCCFANVL